MSGDGGRAGSEPSHGRSPARAAVHLCHSLALALAPADTGLNADGGAACSRYAATLRTAAASAPGELPLLLNSAAPQFRCSSHRTHAWMPKPLAVEVDVAQRRRPIQRPASIEPGACASYHSVTPHHSQLFPIGSGCYQRLCTSRFGGTGTRTSRPIRNARVHSLAIHIHTPHELGATLG